MRNLKIASILCSKTHRHSLSMTIKLNLKKLVSSLLVSWDITRLLTLYQILRSTIKSKI